MLTHHGTIFRTRFSVPTQKIPCRSTLLSFLLEREPSTTNLRSFLFRKISSPTSVRSSLLREILSFLFAAPLCTHHKTWSRIARAFGNRQIPRCTTARTFCRQKVRICTKTPALVMKVGAIGIYKGMAPTPTSAIGYSMVMVCASLACSSAVIFGRRMRRMPFSTLAVMRSLWILSGRAMASLK